MGLILIWFNCSISFERPSRPWNVDKLPLMKLQKKNMSTLKDKKHKMEQEKGWKYFQYSAGFALMKFTWELWISL